MTSGGHHWRPVQTCSLQDPPPHTHWCWHLVAIEAHAVGASGRYASYWNAFSCYDAFVTRGGSRMLRRDDPRGGKRQHTTISPTFRSEERAWFEKKKTRMHSSRIHTVRCSGCRGGGNVCLGAVCPRGCLLGGVYLPRPRSRHAPCRLRDRCLPDPESDTPSPPPPHTLWTEFLTHLWEHYLSATTVADGKNPQLRDRGGGGGAEDRGKQVSGGRSPTMIITQTRTSAVLEGLFTQSDSECEIKVTSGAVLVCFPRGASNDLMGQNKT